MNPANSLPQQNINATNFPLNSQPEVEGLGFALRLFPHSIPHLICVRSRRRRLFCRGLDIVRKEFYKSSISFVQILDLSERDSDQETVLVWASLSKPTRRRRGNCGIDSNWKAYDGFCLGNQAERTVIGFRRLTTVRGGNTCSRTRRQSRAPRTNTSRGSVFILTH